jgi:DNA invertase Pin-like site-specific DNA recombinase
MMNRDKDTAPSNAVAYYRSTIEDPEGTIERQREEVRRWAEEHGLEIVREFEDRDAAGPEAKHRPGFDELMTKWVSENRDFRYILCRDASLWGRFQGIDLSACYIAECRRVGKQVLFTIVGMPSEADPLYSVCLNLQRFRASLYSDELGAKIRRGRSLAAEKGHWTGGNPPYGLRRLLVDEKGNPLVLLEPGQRKHIHNHRVALVAGEKSEVVTIRRIFRDFVVRGHSVPRIAKGLKANQIPSPGGNGWTARHVRACLRNKAYVVPIVYCRKTSRQADTPNRWVRKTKATMGVISVEQFEQAQERLNGGRH